MEKILQILKKNSHTKGMKGGNSHLKGGTKRWKKLILKVRHKNGKENLHLK
jgi:hypothetical protein